MTKRFLIFGTGRIASEYANCLSSVDLPFAFCGRRRGAVDDIAQRFNTYGYVGLDEIPENGQRYSHAIICISIDDSFVLLEQIIRLTKIPNILAEKPAALSHRELLSLQKLEEEKGKYIRIGYNRRFYSSVQKARQIAKHEGLTSMKIIFNEATDRIPFDKFSKNVLQHWIHANSSHVLDAGFYIAGSPHNIDHLNEDKVGQDSLIGRTFEALAIGEDCEINLEADWSKPGSWLIQFETGSARYVLSPIEKLYEVMANGETKLINEVSSDGLKPGFLEQLMSFTNQSKSAELLTIEEQAHHLKLYQQLNNNHQRY